MGAPFSAADLRHAAESVVVALAREGDSDAFTEIVRRRHGQVRRFMHYLCGHRDDGDDLAQQVFIKAWRSMHQLKSAEAFGAWLKKIMITTWLEQVRRKGLPYFRDVDPAETAARRDSVIEGSDLEAALAQLPVPMRLCVVLAYHEGMTHEEIAAAVKAPLGTVKSNINRGSARLREILAGYDARQ